MILEQLIFEHFILEELFQVCDPETADIRTFGHGTLDIRTSDLRTSSNGTQYPELLYLE